VSERELLVRRGTAEVPFSRGILARSLLNLGLDATRAHDIASSLHASFLAEGMSLVTTQHLARLVGERLGRFCDPALAGRYERMRRFKRSERPLVLLLGGSTGSGKSTIATEIAHRLHINRILATDSVRHVMRAMISEKLLPSVHRSSFEAWRDPGLQVPPDADPTLAAFREQVQHVAVAVEAVLERSRQENLSIILEGVHLVPGLYTRFASDTRLHFLHLVVYVEQEDTHRERFMARGRGARERPSRRYLDNFAAIRTIQDFLVARARAEAVALVENSDFDAALDRVVGVVLDGVQEPAAATPRLG
jgi:2-phosphoglycerate kinase